MPPKKAGGKAKGGKKVGENLAKFRMSPNQKKKKKKKKSGWMNLRIR